MKNSSEKNKIRYNLLKTGIAIIAIILLAQLFNLQVIHGEEYNNTSNTRLTRESILQSARGNITDRNGKSLAETKMGFNVELYRTKTSTDALNKSILNVVNILEKNGDTYRNNFPISIEPFAHKFSTEEKFIAWKISNKFSEDLTPEQCFYKFKEQYEITTNDTSEAYKIIAIRYEISINGYSAIRPITIAQDISRESIIGISESKEDLGGINIATQAIRKYTSGSLASHIIGYIGRITEEELKVKADKYNSDSYIGKIGIEYLLEDYLKGEDGIRQIDMDIDGNITGEYIYKEAVAGADISLTIDANLQRVAENALKDDIEKIKSGGFSKAYDAKGGAVVAVDVKTGEILALASYPDFEPELFLKGISTEKWNEYRENQSLFNRAVQGAYAPGSIFKMVTAIAGLETGNISRSEKILTKGKYPYAHQPVCWIYSETGGTHGNINVSEAIKYSCNYFFYEVGRRMGMEVLEKYAKYFGLGQKTGIELPGETSGVLATRENLEKNGTQWNLGNTLSAAIGQGQNNFSPIQIARYVSMLTNGGKQITPTVIKSAKKLNVDITKEVKEYVKQSLGIDSTILEDLNIKPENLKAVLEGMKGVTGESDGTAYGTFRNFSVEVGGKTGSAEAGEYTNGWFVGFAPYENPEIAVVVMVENANKGSYTAQVAKEIMSEYFGLNNQKSKENTTETAYAN